MRVELSSFYLNGQVKRELSTEHYADAIRSMAEAALLSNRHIYPGYRQGVVLVKLNHTLRLPNKTAEITTTDTLVAKYEARVPGEEPRKKIYVSLPIEKVTSAKSLFAVLYSKEVLAEDGDYINSDWAIVAHVTSMQDEPEPMDPETLIANHFHLSGGTHTNMDPIVFEDNLHKSVQFWKNRAYILLEDTK